MVKMAEVILNGRYKIKIPQHRADRPEWYTPQGWEKARLEELETEIKRQVREGKRCVVYYVGAEEGEMAALCQMWGAEVVLFEPNPKVWSNMKAIWEANGLKDPLASFDAFASNEVKNNPLWNQRWPVHIDEPVIGNHGFKELYLEGDNYPQVTIDAVSNHLTVPPTIITFDCEGSDWQVLKGAAKTLKQYKPAIFGSIHPEFMFHQFGQYANDFRNWIKGFGYRETILDYQHELHVMYLPEPKE